MAAMTISFRQSVLPWALAHDDETRFRRIFTVVLVGSLGFGLALRVITLAPPEQAPAPVLPPPIW